MKLETKIGSHFEVNDNPTWIKKKDTDTDRYKFYLKSENKTYNISSEELLKPHKDRHAWKAEHIHIIRHKSTVVELN